MVTIITYTSTQHTMAPASYGQVTLPPTRHFAPSPLHHFPFTHTPQLTHASSTIHKQ